MKPLSLTLAIIVIIASRALCQTAQTKQQIDFGLYRWNNNVPMKECLRDGTISPGTGITDAEAGQRFRVVEISGDDAVIQILNYTKKLGDTIVTTEPAKFMRYNFKSDLIAYRSIPHIDKISGELDSHQRYFKVPVSYIISSATKWYGRNVDLSVGVLALPLKFRLKDGDFTGSFTLGATGGVKMRASHYKDTYHNFLIGFGISNITLDSNTVSKNKKLLVSNLSALTCAVGYLFQSGKYQAGIFFGRDFLTHDNQERFDWRYQGKTWISIGFGFSIFGDGSDKKDASDVSQ